MDAYRDRIAGTGRVKERKRARVERGAGDVPVEPGNRDDEQMAVRHADASGGDITENQHDENRMRDIHIGKRASESASEEQLDKLRKTVRFEQEAPSAASSSGPVVALEHPASVETRDHESVGTSEEVLDWYRGEDAGDLKRSEWNELVENMICLNAVAEKIWKSNPKIMMDEKS